MYVLVLESDRLSAQCIKEELARRNLRTQVVASADDAVAAADKEAPAAVVSELSLPGHSGSEFFYEFRTYKDWQDIPIIIYSSLNPSKHVKDSKDWQHLGIDQVLYKPDNSLQKLGSIVEGALDKQ